MMRVEPATSAMIVWRTNHYSTLQAIRQASEAHQSSVHTLTTSAERRDDALKNLELRLDKYLQLQQQFGAVVGLVEICLF